jgi:hypothetical protein
LRRATVDDLAAVVALQHAAYAKNRAILGVEPVPLLADYGQIFAGMRSGSQSMTAASTECSSSNCALTTS